MGGQHILAVDPGGTSGLAWCPVEVVEGSLDERFGNVVETGDIVGSVPEQAWKISKGIFRLDVVALACESSDHFLLRRREGTLRKDSLIPIKMEGALGAVCYAVNQQRGTYKHGLSFTTQTPANAKTTYTDKRLKLVYGVNLPGTKLRHQRDAVRHLLLLLTRMRASPQFKAAVLGEQ